MNRIIRLGKLPIALGAALLLAPSNLVFSADKADLKPVATVEGITEYKLANGLRVLLFPDPSKQLVTVNLTVLVGSRHEGYGETGMAHLLEHMLFKGTPTFPKIPKALSDHGAGNRYNGSTWVDRTNYYETMPASDENLEFGIKLEADRLVNSFVKREDLISEMTVVRNEFEMGENSPEAILSQRMTSAAYGWHNYGKSTIGNRSDIERVPIENLQAFYRKYYRVDNCVLVIAGSFEEKKALDFIDKYFGALKAGKEPVRNTYTEEPAQDGDRNVVLRRVGEVGAVGVVYHVPAGAHPDFPAIDVLEQVLTSAPSGRLYKALVETKKASRINGSAFAWHDPGMIEILAKVDEKEIDDAKKILIDTCENIAKNPITDAEVARVLARYKKQQEQILADSEAFAVQLSEWAGCGDWRLFFVHRDRLEKVTAKDVNAVAVKYLTRNNRTAGVYLPVAKAERAEIPESPKVADLVKDYKGRANLAQGEAFDPTPENIEKRVVRGKIGDVQTAFLAKKTRGETVNLQLNIRYGNEKSLQGFNTAAEQLGALMRRGTKNLNREQLSDALEKLHTEINITSELGLLSITLETKRANLEAALKLLKEILREPSFPEAELEVLKREQRERLLVSKSEPQAIAFITLNRKLNSYVKDDIRYKPTIDESLELMAALKRDTFVKLFEKQLGARGEVAIVGDFDPAVASKGLESIFGSWVSDVPYERIEKPAKTSLKGGVEKIETPDKANAVYAAGIMNALKDTDPEYPAAMIGNHLFGGAGLASRLSQRVRGEEGLSYGIGTMFTADAKDSTSRFLIYAITNPANMGKVQTLVSDEISKIRKDGVSAAELNEGRKALLQSMKMQRSDDDSVARQLANGLFIGRTYQFYTDLEKQLEKLQPDDVQKAIKKLLDPDRLLIIEAGDFKK